MHDKDLKRNSCNCVKQVNLENFCELLDKRQKDISSDENPFLLCATCRSVSRSPLKKKKCAGDDWLSKKKKSSPAEISNGKVEEIFLCATCAVCFCFEHAKEHPNQVSISPKPDSLEHKLFFVIPTYVDTPNDLSAMSLPTDGSYSYRTTGDSVTIQGRSATAANPNALTSINQQHKWPIKVWCSSCSKAPGLLRSDVALTDAHAHDHRMGNSVEQELAVLLYNFFSSGRTWKEYMYSKRRILYSHSRAHADSHNRSRVAPRSGGTGGYISSTSISAHPNTSRSWADLEVMVKGHVAGIENVRNTCYFNSVLQCILQCKSFTQPILDLTNVTTPGHLTQSLQKMIWHLRRESVNDLKQNTMYSDARNVLHQLSQISPLFSEDEQQDCQELYLTLINGVDEEFDKMLSKEERERRPQLSFKGEFSTQVECEICKKCFFRSEMFMALSVPLEDSVENGLRKFFTPMYLHGKDQYACENCFLTLSKDNQEKHNAGVNAENEKKAKSKRRNGHVEKKSLNCIYSDAVVRTSISRLGGSLALHLLRFHRDLRGLQKDTRAVDFSLELDLSNYVSEKLKRNCTRARHTPPSHACYLPALRQEQLEFSGKSEKVFARNWQVVPEYAHTSPPKSAEGGRQERRYEGNGVHYSGNNNHSGDYNDEDVYSSATADDTIHLEEALPSLTRHLVGIVTHRGSLHGGHYVAYVRNMDMPDRWFRCDDEDVEVVNVSSVLACRTEVYMLFYE